MNKKKTIEQMRSNDFYNKVFTCGDATVSRWELESFACPFYTKDVSDETMQKIVSLMNEELSKWNFETVGNDGIEFSFEDALYFEMDNAAAHFHVPYYQMNEPAINLVTTSL